jgi:ATP-dependent Lhr-like helicase
MAGVARIWLGDGATVVSHGSPREIELQLIDLGIDGASDTYRMRAASLSRWLNDSRAEKVLVFANSRNGAHALAAHLRRELTGSRWPVHLHFGILAAAERERVEEEMRTSRYGICVATTTLEIGIDIGDVDAVVLSDLPRTVSGFLQRIGRGNRRSGICRVIAFRDSDDDEHLARALLDCGRRGELDDVHEYDRHSVRFQQVLSLCWRATRQDRSLSIATLCAEDATEAHTPVVHDMISTGCLASVRGALVPCDRLMDDGDAGRIHTVIVGRSGNAVVDVRTGKTAMRDADESTAGGAVFHTGSMRRLTVDSDGGVYLAGEAARSHPLARIKATGQARPMSRRILWSLARQRGIDATRWQLNANALRTWGGETLNALLAALLTRAAPGRHFVPSIEGVSGAVNAIDLSIESIRELARQTEQAGDLPLNIAEKFVGPSRFLSDLSATLAAEEKRRAIPWHSFHRWLDCVTAIDLVG